MKISQLLGLGSNADQKSIDFLEAAIIKQTQPGFDYLKFKQSIEQLAGLKLDVPTSLKSAFAIASTMGVTKESLLQSGRHYLTILGEEKKQFDQALNNQVQQRIDSKKDELINLQKQIEEHKKQIARLEKQILEYQDKIARSDEEVAEAKASINQTKMKFENTYQQFVSAIESDMAAIQQNL
jgi:septal ring factor EnvC (AmiA/AmiB activator)